MSNGTSVELIRYSDGRVALTHDGDVIWAGDGDDDFLSEFGEIVDSEELDEVANWLESEGYQRRGRQLISSMSQTTRTKMTKMTIWGICTNGNIRSDN